MTRPPSPQYRGGAGAVSTPPGPRINDDNRPAAAAEATARQSSTRDRHELTLVLVEVADRLERRAVLEPLWRRPQTEALAAHVRIMAHALARLVHQEQQLLQAGGAA